MKVIIAAAGTAGHINPGLAIANKIKEKNKDAQIMLILLCLRYVIISDVEAEAI